ncbi:cytochrome P450 [Pseudoroseomonas cervicalis]|uniref:cytochrome P450 n=1 Tax=Teichococcus cervicalis TaxID=204525 RepID=UPI00278944F1|nr:cytochrome P450 [Pseudoroseomonas cervicalis]MDQ1079312.1 cytochrome P450 [Pseudoroseomonas cervicalis]
MREAKLDPALQRSDPPGAGAAQDGAEAVLAALAAAADAAAAAALRNPPPPALLPAGPAFVPPHPPRPPRLAPLPQLLRTLRRSFLDIWPQPSFERSFIHRRVLMRDIYICNSPETVQQAFVDQPAAFERKSPQMRHALRPLLGDGLFISDGALWKERRRVVAPVTHVSRLAALTPPITEAAAERASAWLSHPAGQPIDMLAEMGHLTAEIICRTIFGRQLGGSAAATVVGAFAEYQRVVGQTDLLSLLGLPDWVPRWQPLRARRAGRRIQRVLDRLIGDILDGAAGGEASLIRTMAEGVHPRTGRRMDKAAFRNEAAVLFMAGHETTANTLAWAWYLLSQSPAVLARLQAEADALDGPARFADMARLPYTRAVVEETLRLYPPVPLLAREAVTEGEIGGRHVRKGSLVLAVPWLLHRHRLLWQEPDAFWPERFLPGGEAASKPRYTWIPFAIGPRVCTGAAFGLTEAVLCLATLARAVTPRLAPGAVVYPVCRLTLRPGETLPMLLERRHG